MKFIVAKFTGTILIVVTAKNNRNLYADNYCVIDL